MADLLPEDIVGTVARAARHGRLDEAAGIASAAILAGDRNPIMLALAGAVELKRARFDRAISYLKEAKHETPNDMAITANLVEALYRSGDTAAALALCNDVSASADRSLRVARIGGHLAQQSEQFELARTLYEIILNTQPDDWSVWNNLGNSWSGLGKYDEAVKALKRAAQLAPDSPPVQVNYGNALVEVGRISEAEQVLLTAAERFETDPTPLLALSTIYTSQAREDDAYDAIKRAARRAPDMADIQSDWGQEAARRNLYEEAEGAYEAALALQPDLGPAYVGLASVYERMNREHQLDPLHARALQHEVDERSISFIEALRFKRSNQFEDAFDALERAGDVVVPARRLHLRGVMLDRLGQYDEAFSAFQAMNDFWRADPSQPSERARLYRAEIAKNTALLTPSWVDSWTAVGDNAGRPVPIFLVGFPRSGTTLLDTMLMADPRVRVLEEEPFLGEAEHALGGFEALPNANAALLESTRRQYFDRVASVTELDSDTILIDKHPMHLSKVAAILRLFPEARFLLSLRHPCDVLLSCFITNFRVNNAMANFLDLHDAAALYDLLFANWEKSRRCFDPPVVTVVYERLVEDPERELKSAFDALGLQWPDHSPDHRSAARARGTVRTASYSQVTEPIYRRASGRWQRYAGHLKSLIPTIEPWVDRFGYSLDDGRYRAWPDSPSIGHVRDG